MDWRSSASTTDESDTTGGGRLRRRLASLLGRRLRPGRSIGELLSIDRAVIIQALKVAVSAGLSWGLAQWWLDSPAPIWAPLSASLIALLTVRASVRDAAEKVLGVVVGVLVAIWLGGLIGLHAWSIAVIVGIGFLVGKVLRLGPGAAAQIPINGLFVLALGSSQIEQRFLDTLIGAAVAVVVNFVIVPPNHVAPATRSVRILADGVVDVLTTIAAGIVKPWPAEQTEAWLRSAREQSRLAAVAEADVQRAVQSMSLHPTRSSWTASIARLRQADETMQIVETQHRTLARTMRDMAMKIADHDGRQPPMPMASAMLMATAEAIEAFAHTVLRAEKDTQPVVVAGPAHRAIDRARDRIELINADLGDMLTANLDRGVFLGALVVETGRILDELDAGLAKLTPDGSD